MTKNQQLYQKEIQRIKRSIKRYEKKDNLTANIEEVIPARKSQKRIYKKDILALQSIRGKTLKALLAPNLSIYTEIESRLNAIPSVRYFNIHKYRGYMDLTPYKQRLLNFLYDNYANYGSEYIKYLEFNQADIFKNIDAIVFDSDQNSVENSIVQVGYLLKSTGLTREESQDLGDLSEWL